jgi:elongation factor P
MKACDLKKGMTVEIDGKPVLIREVLVQSPSSRSGNTLYKMRGRDLVEGYKVDKSFKGDDQLRDLELERRQVQFLYNDGVGYTFMDVETYDQYSFDAQAMEDDKLYLSDGLEGIMALIVEGKPQAIELPATVNLEITECAPSIKGASASARTKPATLNTGLVVQVPEYLAPGELIKVNTITGEFMSRA